MDSGSTTDRLWSGYARLKTYWRRLASWARPDPKPEPGPVWKRNPCQEIPDSSGDETIKLWIWHDHDLESAKVVAEHAEYVVASAFGDQYDVDVRVVEEPLSWKDVRDYTGTDDLQDGFFGFIQGKWTQHSGWGKDGNILLDGGGEGPEENVTADGGGSIATAPSVAPSGASIGDLADDCVRRFGTRGEADDLLAQALHELVFHCLGGSHDEDGNGDGAVKTIDGRDFPTLGSATYVDGPTVYELSDTMLSKGPEVQ